MLALAAVELRAFPGGGSQAGQNRTRCCDQAIFAASGGKFTQAGAKYEAPTRVAADHSMMLKSDREAMGSWAG